MGFSRVPGDRALRSRHIEGDIILVEGVPEDYDPTPVARAIRDAVPVE